MSTKTKIEEAVDAFRKAGGILTMSEAMQLGIHRRQLYASPNAILLVHRGIA